MPSRFIDLLGLSIRFASEPNPPMGLFAIGRVDVDAFPTVGIVGSRHATPYGLRIAKQFGSELSQAGVVVVSGLARGIDAAAHEGAIANGCTPPVAVVGGGLDIPY